MSVLSAIVGYVTRLGVLEDEALNVVALGGKPNETVSTDASDHEATAAWARGVCAILSVLVQKDHCAKVRAGVAMDWLSDIRACFWISFVMGGGGVLTRFSLHLLLGWLPWKF